MDKIKAKLQSLSQDRRYMMFVGVAIIILGLIGLGSSGFSLFLGILLGAFCLLVGYYGSDMKKSMEEFKHDIMEAKDVAAAAAEKTVEIAKDSAAKVEDTAKKAAATPVKKPAAKKAVAKK